MKGVFLKNNTKQGTYVAWLLSMQNKLDLEKWLKNNNITPDLGSNVWHPHCTVMYDPYNTLPNIARGFFQPVIVPCENLCWQQLPTRSNKNCLVLQLNCSQLIDRHFEIKTMGAKHFFTEYIPHVTVFYELKKPVNIYQLTLPNFDLIFDFEYQSTVN